MSRAAERWASEWQRCGAEPGPHRPSGSGASLVQRLFAVAVVVDVARTLQRDLVPRDRAALYCLRSLGLRMLGLRGRWLRGLVGFGGVNVADWADHMSKIGRGHGIFSQSGPN